MRRLSPPERRSVWLWVIAAVIAWNGIYDVLMTSGAREYLFRAALHDAGRGPAVAMAQMMDVTVRHATWISTLWASIILLAGLVTVRLLRTPNLQLPTSKNDNSQGPTADSQT